MEEESLELFAFRNRNTSAGPLLSAGELCCYHIEKWRSLNREASILK
jgi:hypothetical protein